MKLFGRIIVVVLIISIAVLSGYFAYKFIIPAWASIVFYLYISVGLFLVLVGGFMVIKNSKKHQNINDLILKSVKKAVVKKEIII